MVPVVRLTSSHEEQDLVSSYMGVNAYIIKPVNFHEFVDAIREIGLFGAVVNQPPPG